MQPEITNDTLLTNQSGSKKIYIVSIIILTVIIISLIILIPFLPRIFKKLSSNSKCGYGELISKLSNDYNTDRNQLLDRLQKNNTAEEIKMETAQKNYTKELAKKKQLEKEIKNFKKLKN